ncbi:hypothetical protein N9B94_03580 [Verrucomicrobia bacterium]|nr:hypothetical protein [Verrucomicrobiota bacterium]
MSTDGTLRLKRLGDPEQEISYPHENRAFAGDCCYFTQRHFVDGLLGNTPFETSGEDYLKSMAVQEAVYRAAETKLPQPI